MATSRLFEHNDFGGRSMLLDNPSSRYLVIPSGYVGSLNFNDRTSSLQLRSGTPAVPSMCVLFEHSRFTGRLQAFAFNGTRDVRSLPAFNDLTTSVLLVNHDPSPTRSVLPLRQLAGNRLNDAIDQELRGESDVSRNGDVLLRFTIDLYEVSLFGVDLMLIEVPIRVHTPWPFSDYDAKIRYWIDLYLDAERKVKGYVAAWGYWIEGGILTGSIEGQLRPKVESKIGSVESRVNSMLLELDFHRWTDVYLMPGRASVSDDYDGSVNDDCTVVLPYR